MRRARFVRTPVLAIAALTAALVGCAPATMSAQQEGVKPSAPAVDTAFLHPFEWRNLGPNRGGRSIAVAGSDSRPLEYYFGATGGGLWKTADGGTTWHPVTDGKIQSASVGAVEVCSSNPDVVYIGMGEADIRGNIMPGDGVYRSDDAGKTWTHVGLEDARNIAKIRISPSNCDVAWVAAMGHYGESNPERGVFKTTDGGKTWKKVLYKDANTGAVELALDPKNADVLYAAMYEFFRKPWGMSSGGPGSGLYKSTDGGDTWTNLSRNPGMPSGIMGKIGVSVSPVDDSRVYAIIENANGGVFVSDDAGATWTKTNDERKLRQRAFYYTRIYADPQKKDVVYVLNTAMYKSTDGGKKFDTRIRTQHGDNHDLWIAPSDAKRMIEGNDGGANVSVDGGQSWTSEDYPTAQIYHISTTTDKPYHICGAQQDNGTFCVPVDRPQDWYSVAGGESGYIAPDPNNPDITFGGSYGGYLQRYNRVTHESRMVNPWPDNPMGYSSEDIAERFQWTFPIVFSHVDPNVMYVGSQHVWRTDNQGQSWERISPDLTRHAPETMGPSGGPITKDQTGVETYGTVFTIAPSYQDANTIWAGSDDGMVHVTRDGGKTWTDVTPAGLPEQTRISLIEASPITPGKAYMAGNRYLLGDFKPYLYRTEDYGQTWTEIDAGIPEGDFTFAIREDPYRQGMLYAGTEKGIWVSWDDGAHWQSLSRNLPVTQVPDIAVERHDLAIATHGRSFYILRDIDALRQLTPDIEKSDVHLFQPSNPVRSESQLAVYYWLENPAKEVKVEILDSKGDVVQTYTGHPKKKGEQRGGQNDEFARFFGGGSQEPDVTAGMHRFNWNLRYPGATQFPGMVLWAGSTRFGPVAVPGDYTVRLTADGKSQEAQFTVEMNPNSKSTLADLQAQFDLSQKIVDKTSQANNAVRLIRGVKNQVQARMDSSSDAQVAAQGKALNDSLSAVEQEIYQVKNRSNQDPLNFPIKLNNKIAALLGVVQAGDYPPTDPDYEIFRMLSEKLDAQLARMNGILDAQLPAYNDLLKSKGLKPVTREMIPQEEPTPDSGS